MVRRRFTVRFRKGALVRVIIRTFEHFSAGAIPGAKMVANVVAQALVLGPADRSVSAGSGKQWLDLALSGSVLSLLRRPALWAADEARCGR